MKSSPRHVHMAFPIALGSALIAGAMEQRFLINVLFAMAPHGIVGEHASNAVATRLLNPGTCIGQS